VGRWTTPYELALPATTPDEVRVAISRHKNDRGSRGLHITIRGERVKATISDDVFADKRSAPRLKAWLSQRSRGSLISGKLHWAGLLTNLWGRVLFGLGLAGYSAYYLIRPGAPWYGIGFFALALCS